MKVAEKFNIPTKMQKKIKYDGTIYAKQNNNNNNNNSNNNNNNKNDNSQTQTLSPITNVVDISVPHPSQSQS
jgi:hypothetical protein